MEQSIWNEVRLYRANTVIVGTGAAGYNAADELWNHGQQDIAVISEHVLAGTSRNTGSDKQTYYKLTLSGNEPDSVGEMAQTLFSGQCVDGEHALCEAALSAPCFLKLAGLGVPFPRNRYGEYVGYKTDHDPRHRATSVGPYTSREMTEVLERSVKAKGIPILDKLQVISILSDSSRAYGLLCLDLDAETAPARFVLFHCKNILLATGGPAGMYRDSVYPFGHYGATGIAFAAGAAGKNLTEWQYGLASLKPRWNVSGTYMQALPRFFSTKQDGSDEKEFLYLAMEDGFFADEGDLLTKVFLKGYQWPFDVRKVEGGSSIIDILVFLEQSKGRRVFLDYRENPGGRPLPFSLLEPEALEYLERAGASFGTPFERLVHMNSPAVDFYRDRGVDLASQPLEIALCAQHNNGGLAVDAWWQTNIKGLFCAGEAAATHGVYRPGGSALNAGQVGSARAALYIAARCQGAVQGDEEGPFPALARQALAEASAMAEGALSRGQKSEGNLRALWDQAAERMSLYGAAIRNPDSLKKAGRSAKDTYEDLEAVASAKSQKELSLLFRLRSMLLCQYVYLCAMSDYMAQGGGSRGSALYTSPTGKKPYKALPDTFTYVLDQGAKGGMVQEVVYQEGACRFTWRAVHPIPVEDNFFENVWREYRRNQNII